MIVPQEDKAAKRYTKKHKNTNKQSVKHTEAHIQTKEQCCKNKENPTVQALVHTQFSQFTMHPFLII